MNKEATELRIDKAVVHSVHNDEAFINNVTSILAKNMSEKIYRVVEANGEVIIRAGGDTVNEDILDPDHIVFRKMVGWQPLVRCKDCIHNDTKRIGGGYYCTRYGMWGNDGSSFFCADGAPKEKTDDN